MSENTELMDKSLEILKNKLEGVEIIPDNIAKIVKIAMEIVEVTELKGVEQKDLCIKLIRCVIVDAPITDDKEKLLIDLIDSGILSSTIDLVVMAAKGGLEINDIAAAAVGCCASFLKTKKK